MEIGNFENENVFWIEDKCTTGWFLTVKHIFINFNSVVDFLYNFQVGYFTGVTVGVFYKIKDLAGDCRIYDV